MKNSRLIVLLIVLVVVIFSILLIRYAKDVYKALPATLESSVPVVPFEEWREFQPENSKFKALFPGLPQHATETVSDVSSHSKRIYDMYVAQKANGTIFMVTLIKYTEEMSVEFSEVLIQNIIEEIMASNPKNKLVSVTEGTFQGFHASDFEIQNDEVRMNGKVFVKGNTLFIVTYIAKTPDYALNEYEHFIKSFQLGS